MNLGARIKKCRQEAGWSQEKVAEQLGVSRQSVTKWESGQSMPSTANLFQLAQLFGTTVDFLTKEESVPEPPTERVVIKTVLVEKKPEEKPAPQWVSSLRWVSFGSLLICLFALIVWFMGINYDNFDMAKIAGYVAGVCFYLGFGCQFIVQIATRKKD